MPVSCEASRWLRSATVIGLLLVTAPPRLLAHDGLPIAPHDLASAWSFEPLVVLMLTLTALLYARGWRAMRRASSRDRGASAADTTCFIAGWLTLAVALVSPVHALGGSLFSAHMAQHELLMVVVAPLLVLARPLVPMLWALPIQWRRGLGGLAGRSAVRKPWHLVTGAPFAFVTHALAIWIWHLPGPYQLSIGSDLAHTAQHASFLVTALLFWWALVNGHDGKMGYGAAVLYIFGTALHTTILGALLTFADAPWYPIYGRSTMLWGLTALEDQQLAGLIMWIPAGIAYVVTALVLLVRWIGESERRVKVSEGLSVRNLHPAPVGNGTQQERGIMRYGSARRTLGIVAVAAVVVAGCDNMGGKGDSTLQAAVDATPMVAGDSAPTLTDGNIFAILDVANANDSAGGALAVSRGTSADVKAFGRQMVADHHAMRKEGQDLAKTLGVTPATPPNDSTEAMHDSASATLKALAKGREFDRAYIDHEVSMHQEVLNKARSLRDMTKNKEIQGLIDKAAPKIEDHLNKAMDIQRKLGGGVTAKADSARKAP